MAKYLLATTIFLFGLILALPLTAFADYNDVQYSSSQNLYLPGTGLTITVSSGAKVASLQVGSSNIVITGAYVDTDTKSTITLTSADKVSFSNDWGLSTTCGDTSSSLTVTWGASSSSSITITPTGVCSSSGGGGGGGGGGGVQTVVVTPTTTTGTVTVTPSGGGQTTLTTSAGTTATVLIPANTVASTTTLTVTEASASDIATGSPAPSGMTIVSGFNITATAGTAAVTSFSNNVTITITYTDAQIAGLNESSLKIYRWNGTEWVALNTTINTATNTLTATTTAFSKFAVMGSAGEVTTPTPTTPTTPTTKPISEMTINELKAEITRIAALIANLQAELAKMLGTAQAFATDLYYGLKGNADVKRLQEFLISKGYLASGLNTGNYLSLTVAAVKAYQTAKGITPVNGRCGPKTRAAINADLGVSQ
jgi:PGF-pre-PGF domain-containing protein